MLYLVVPLNSGCEISYMTTMPDMTTTTKMSTMLYLVVPLNSGCEISDTKIGAETKLLPAL